MRKRTRRKVYNTEPGFNPVLHAIMGAAVTDQASLDKLRMRELSALEAFKMGTATPHDWKSMADMVNVTETFVAEGIGTEAADACKRAEGALEAGHARYQEHERIGRAAGEYEALLDVFEYHDLMRASVARSVYERIIQKTADRIRSAHPDSKVLI